MNTNKKSLSLNLESATGKKLFQKLVSSADILIESWKPGTLSALGLGYDELAAINPGLN